MVPPLVEASDLVGYPGAPFPPALVNEAAGAVRAEARWHIAPEVTETVEVYTAGSRVAILPSLHVVSVAAVRNADTGAEVSGWRLRKDAVALTSRHPLPEVIEVDLTHGYEKCPPELIGVVASRVSDAKRGNIRREALGTRSVDFETTDSQTRDPLLSLYTLPQRP